jgi:hypothetical protein
MELLKGSFRPDDRSTGSPRRRCNTRKIVSLIQEEATAGNIHHLAFKSNYLRFEVFTAVTMKNGVFWDVTPCSSCKNRRSGGTWRLLHQDDKNR